MAVGPVADPRNRKFYPVLHLPAMVRAFYRAFGRACVGRGKNLRRGTRGGASGALDGIELPDDNVCRLAAAVPSKQLLEPGPLEILSRKTFIRQHFDQL